MNFWTAENVRAITRGQWLRRPGEQTRWQDLRGISTDSRSIRPGQIFCALRGERFDGHRFLRQAAGRGASLLLADTREAVDPDQLSSCGVLLVDDTQAALSQLAAAYRDHLSARVIAVTGSVGKTTVKDMVHTVLGAHMTGTASPNSYNNHVGVPLTILSASTSDTYLIVEVGTNAPGEIAALARIVRPDIAVITAVGPAHLEGLGDLGAVLREKASLLSHVRPNGQAIVHGEVEGLADYRHVVPAMVRYGRGPDCDLRLTRYEPGAEAAGIEVNGRWRFDLPLLGEHNALNALATIAVAQHMRLGEQQIADALLAVAPPEMRMQPQRVGPNGELTLLNDAYNANPQSMAGAIETLTRIPAAGRRVAVLGDMLELGDAGPEYHRELGDQVVEADLDLVIFIGQLSMFAAEQAARRWPGERLLTIPVWSDQTPEDVVALLQPGDTVLLKGSRGAGLERLIEPVARRFERHAAPDPSPRGTL